MSTTVRLQLRVSPAAAKASIVGRHGSGWKLRVAAPPAHGAANAAVVTLLARTLALPRRDISIVSGHAGRDKLVELAGLDRPELERRLEHALLRERRASA